jgi:hypothetical protein
MPRCICDNASAWCTWHVVQVMMHGLWSWCQGYGAYTYYTWDAHDMVPQWNACNMVHTRRRNMAMIMKCSHDTCKTSSTYFYTFWCQKLNSNHALLVRFHVFEQEHESKRKSSCFSTVCSFCKRTVRKLAFKLTYPQNLALRAIYQLLERKRKVYDIVITWLTTRRTEGIRLIKDHRITEGSKTCHAGRKRKLAWVELFENHSYNHKGLIKIAKDTWNFL